MEITTLQEFLTALLQLVITAAIPLVLKFVSNYVSTLVAQKTQEMENTQLREYLTNTTSAVLKAVDTTYQTYVDSLKAAGNFDSAAQKDAFEKARTKALSIITDDMRNAVEILYGDFNEWLDQTIEQSVAESKLLKQGAIIVE